MTEVKKMEKNIEWENRKPEIIAQEINHLRLIYTEIKDTKGKVLENRITEIHLENLKDINLDSYGENVLFRITHKPLVFEQEKEKKDSVTGLVLQKESVKKSPLLKDIDVKFLEIQKALDKAQKKNPNQTITLQIAVTPLIKVENKGQPEERTDTYYKLEYKQVSQIEILK